MKYIIKQHYEATEKNTNFAGEVIDYYTGKGHTAIGKNAMPIPYYIENYGFSTKAAAMRALKSVAEGAKWESSRGFWNVTCSLVEC